MTDCQVNFEAFEGIVTLDKRNVSVWFAVVLQLCFHHSNNRYVSLCDGPVFSQSNMIVYARHELGVNGQIVDSVFYFVNEVKVKLF